MANAAQHKEISCAPRCGSFASKATRQRACSRFLTESGAPKGSLYHYFPDGKEALGQAAVELAGELIAQMLASLAARHKQPKAFVKAYCEVMAGWMESRSSGPAARLLPPCLETAPRLAGVDRSRGARNRSLD